MATSDPSNPFKGRIVNTTAPMRVLHRFEKPGGRVMEVRERKVATWEALEFLVFLDGDLLESQMFHGARLAEYPSAMAAVIKQHEDDGWEKAPIEDAAPS